MNNQEKFKRLFDFVKSIEDEQECPFVEHNTWFNTTPDGCIDMESVHGSTVTDDIGEIEEILTDNGLKLEFTMERPCVVPVKANHNKGGH